MPELPEVETIVRTLRPILIDRSILNIEILRSCTVQGDEALFCASLKNETFTSISRIGKYIIFHLTNNKVIISHLRMEGKFYEYLESEDNSKYARMIFHLDNNHKLCYDDSRCFGIMILSDENHYKEEKEIAKLGKEPFDADIDEIINKTKRNNGPIKSTLLDQSIITGLGNIYVDETLYASKIHPLTETNLVSKSQWEIIIDNAKKILNNAIKLGGSTIKSYHPGKDVSGEFQNKIKIYGKNGEICPICGKTYRFTKIGGRGTTFCPGCQHKEGKSIKVAITGKIASGKSLALSIFKDNGIKSISSDEIVSSLYQDEKVVNDISKMFNLSFDKKVDKYILREYLKNNPKSIKKINKYIHPLVGKEIENFFAKNKGEILAVEVPLLFESGLDRLFDEIIVIDIDKEKQTALINQRNQINAAVLSEIYENNNIFDEYKNKADDLVINLGDKKEFKEKIISLINKLKRRPG